MSNTNYLDGVDVIYWINLDRSKERRNHMKKIFDDNIFNNIKKIRVTAEDSKNSTKIYSMFDITNKKITDEEYACLLSHLNTIKEFSETNLENALIFEDDISTEYKKYWEKSIKYVIENAPKDWEILKITRFSHYFPNKNLYKTWKLYKNKNKNKKKPKNDWSCSAYIINNKAAKKIISDIYQNNKYKLEENMRHEADVYLYLKLKTYIYKYPYFTIRNNNDSFIQNYTYKIKVHPFKESINNFYKKISSKTKRKTKGKNKTKRT